MSLRRSLYVFTFLRTFAPRLETIVVYAKVLCHPVKIKETPVIVLEILVIIN